MNGSTSPLDSSGVEDKDARIRKSQTETSSAPVAVSRPKELKALRVWPAVLVLLLLWGIRLGAGLSNEATLNLMLARFMIPLGLSGIIVLWWLFLSRASIREKLIGTAALAVIVAATTWLAHETVQGFGTMIFAIPWGMTAFAVALILLRDMRTHARTVIALVAAIVGFGYWDLIRTDAILGNFDTQQSWRWETTSEAEFLASLGDRSTEVTNNESSIDSAATEGITDVAWPGFRGPDRRGEQSAVVIDPDWETSPPKELWRIRLGPGWSSFAVADDRLFTQEQRGEIEVISCYRATDGTELWTHSDDSRFWEVVGGAGPRATPTLSDGSLYALGANGLLNKLDPVTGRQLWQRDIRKDAGRDPPQWGFSSSPLVTHGVVIVHGGGKDDKGLLAYDQETGELRWSAAAGNDSYSSPQLSTIDGQTCVLMLTNTGVVFVDPSDGTPLGEHLWEFQGYRVVQPLVLDGSHVLLGTPMGTGTRCIEASWDGAKFVTQELWTSKRMSPYYNDYVSQAEVLYGFDNNIFACIDLRDGQRIWKKGRYGNGQVLLLTSGNQLLITSETGELILLQANPEKHVELARYSALDGRTWNHPVLVGDRLYIRNAAEAACIQLPLLPLSTEMPAGTVGTL